MFLHSKCAPKRGPFSGLRMSGQNGFEKSLHQFASGCGMRGKRQALRSAAQNNTNDSEREIDFGGR